MQNIEDRLLACEAENAHLRKLVKRQTGMWMILLLFILGSGAIAGSSLKNMVVDSVRAREVLVVDSNNVIRARLGGDVPDGLVAEGRIAKRGVKAGGLIIYDDEGIERGGYVTDSDSNAMLTLDTKYQQATLFVAGPGRDKTSSSALKLWTQGSSIELRSDPNGSRLTINDQVGVTLQQPDNLSLAPASCTEFKAIEKSNPGKRYCQARFTDAACNACFQSP